MESLAKKEANMQEPNMLLKPEKSEQGREDGCGTQQATSETFIKSEEVKKESTRERLARHRREVAGHVWIPDVWEQEPFLNDWIDCTAFDASLVNHNIMLARASLINQPSTLPSLPLENS